MTFVILPILDLVWEDHMKTSLSCLSFSFWECMVLVYFGRLSKSETTKKFVYLFYAPETTYLWCAICSLPSPKMLAIFRKGAKSETSPYFYHRKRRHHSHLSPSSPQHHALEIKRMARVSQCSQLCKKSVFPEYLLSITLLLITVRK